MKTLKLTLLLSFVLVGCVKQTENGICREKVGILDGTMLAFFWPVALAFTSAVESCSEYTKVLRTKLPAAHPYGTRMIVKSGFYSSCEKFEVKGWIWDDGCGELSRAYLGKCFVNGAWSEVDYICENQLSRADKQKRREEKRAKTAKE